MTTAMAAPPVVRTSAKSAIAGRPSSGIASSWSSVAPAGATRTMTRTKRVAVAAAAGDGYGRRAAAAPFTSVDKTGGVSFVRRTAARATAMTAAASSSASAAASASSSAAAAAAAAGGADAGSYSSRRRAPWPFSRGGLRQLRLVRRGPQTSTSSPPSRAAASASASAAAAAAPRNGGDEAAANSNGLGLQALEPAENLPTNYFKTIDEDGVDDYMPPPSANLGDVLPYLYRISVAQKGTSLRLAIAVLFMVRARVIIAR